MEIEKLDLIRKLIVISLFSDDDLMDIFVLKGGNALNIIYGITNRASKDIDVSMPIDFDQEELTNIKTKLEKSLVSTFAEEGIHAFDITLTPQPTKKSLNEGKFWGGYKLKFKLIDKSKLKQSKDLDDARRKAIPFDEKQTKTFTVDISKYEFCNGKEETELDGYTIYVYSPPMVVFEKLRAICQQMEQYRKTVPSHHPRPRARDFFDIYTVMEHFHIQISSLPTHSDILTRIFKIKRVPLTYLGEIEGEREFHRSDFNTVKDAVTVASLEEYDFYFDYVLRIVEQLKPLWII